MYTLTVTLIFWKYLKKLFKWETGTSVSFIAEVKRVYRKHLS